jgi:hypothetical protein
MDQEVIIVTFFTIEVNNNKTWNKCTIGCLDHDKGTNPSEWTLLKIAFLYV